MLDIVIHTLLVVPLIRAIKLNVITALPYLEEYHFIIHIISLGKTASPLIKTIQIFNKDSTTIIINIMNYILFKCFNTLYNMKTDARRFIEWDENL